MLTGVQGGRTRRAAKNRQNPATHVRVFRLGVCGLGCWMKGKKKRAREKKKKRKEEKKTQLGEEGDTARALMQDVSVGKG